MRASKTSKAWLVPVASPVASRSMSRPRMNRELEGGHLRATDGPEAVVERGEPVGGRGAPEAGPQRRIGRVVQPAVAQDGRDGLADAVVGLAAVGAYVAVLREVRVLAARSGRRPRRRGIRRSRHEASTRPVARLVTLGEHRDRRGQRDPVGLLHLRWAAGSRSSAPRSGGAVGGLRPRRSAGTALERAREEPGDHR